MFEILTKWLGELTDGSKLSRRAWLVINYTPKGESEAKDISEDISKYFLSMSYADNISGKVDDITLTLEDRGQLWMSDWFPVQGSKLDITLHTYNWSNVNEGELTLELGSYEIDEIEITGMPSTVQIKAVSVTSDSTLRGVKRNRTWENISIWKCADDICGENELSLFWDCKENPNLDHIEQSDQSDLEFMEKVTKDAGLSLKITPEKMIIFDEESYESKEPVMRFVKPGSIGGISSDSNALVVTRFTGYRFRAKTRDIYKECRVKYQKGQDKELIEATFADPNMKDGKTLEVSEQVETVEEAEKLAKKKLRDANKSEFAGTMTMPGNFNMCAGLTVELVNYGRFDGKYIITKASHSISSTFTTSIDLRRCLDGY